MPKTREDILAFLADCTLNDKRQIIECLTNDIVIFHEPSSTLHDDQDVTSVTLNGLCVQITVGK